MFKPFFFFPFYNVFSEFRLPRRHCWPEGMQFPSELGDPVALEWPHDYHPLLSNPALNGARL